MFAFSKSTFFRNLSLLFCTLALAISAQANPNDDRIVNTTVARQNGLELQWFSQVNVSPAVGDVKEIVMTVDENQSTTFFELTYGSSREVYGENDIDGLGQVYGIEGAKAWVNLRQEVLKKSNIDATIKQYVRPKATLYTLTTSGTVQAFDAETGKTNWVVSVGNPTHPAIGIAANANYVAVVSGPYLFCLEAETGLTKWQKPCAMGPTGGVAISDRFIFVTEATGVVEVFPFKFNGLPPQRFVSFGRATVKPHVTDLSVSWPSGRGYYNVASANAPDSIAYRLQADSGIVTQGDSAQGSLFVTSLDGKTYALDEKTGRVKWEFSSGDPFSTGPVALGNSVYVISDLDRLFKLNASDGLLDSNWPRGVEGISRFVAASQHNAYFVDQVGTLIGLNRESGAQVSRVTVGIKDLIFTNTKTDRIYFCSSSGTIQCLRELSNGQPYFHAAEEVDSKPDKDKAAGEMTNPFGESETSNPIADKAEGDNPFGDGNEVKKAEADDPFGGGEKSDDEDPFGGGSTNTSEDKKTDEDEDPFGGG